MEKLTQAMIPAAAVNVPLMLLMPIDQRWQKYRCELKEFRQEPSGDTVRSLRVATRRLRTLMGLLDEAAAYKPLKKAVRSFKEQVSDLDQLRDTEVMLAEVDRQMAQFPMLQSFQQKLQKKEAGALRKARRKFKQVKPGETVTALVRWMGRLDEQEADNIRPKLINSIDESYREVCERFEQVDPADPTTIHCVRLAFKKFRYKIEVLQPLLQDYPAEALQCLDIYQGWMGAVQDTQVLRQALADFAQKNPELDLEPVNQYYQQRLSEAVADYMKHKETIHDFWRPDPGQPFPWRQTDENLPAKTWHCDGA